MPNYYTPYQNYQQPQYYQQPQMSQQIPQQVQAPQMTNGGFMSVRSEAEARNYPVAPGNVMTFKIENQPYVCEKAQGFSQLEGPVFNKYKLVKEEDITETHEPEPEHYIYDDSAIKEEIEFLKGEISELKKKLSAKTKTLTPRKKEEDDE